MIQIGHYFNTYGGTARVWPTPWAFSYFILIIKNRLIINI